MKIYFLALLFVWAPLASSQTPDQAQSSDAGPTILSRSELEVPAETPTGLRGDYFNFFAYGDFTYNSYEPFATIAGESAGKEGYDAGVGVNLLHYYQTGVLSLNYTGGYRGYSGLNSDPASNILQNLSLGFNKLLTRHLTFTFRETGSWTPGGWIPQPVTTPEFALGLNLIAVRTETSLTSVGLIYQLSRRLSLQVGGDFSEIRYKPSIDYTGFFGGDASLGLNYRFTKRTTLSATANYQYFSFLQSRGTSSTDGAYLSLSHLFGTRIEAGVSGGALRTTFESTSAQVFGSTLLIYSCRATTYSPFASGRFSISGRKTSFGLSGGETVSAGNGIFLTSKMIYLTGSFYYAATRKWSFGLNGGYQRLVSIGGGTTGPGEYVSGSADYKLTRHFGIRAAGNYTTYETVTVFKGNSYYNATLGFFFTSADRPLSAIF
jgi:hypothetical protein